MDLKIDTSGTVTLAKLSGELTGRDVERFTEETHDFATGDGAALAIDLSAVDLIDSRGLAALITLSTRSRLSDGKVVLVRPSAFVEGIFNATGLNAWFDICGTLDEAVQRLS